MYNSIDILADLKLRESNHIVWNIEDRVHRQSLFFGVDRGNICEIL